MIVACILLLMAKVHVISLLDKVVYWLDHCSKGWYAVLITGLCLAFSLVFVAKIRESKQKVAHSTFALALFVIIVYTYFRFIDNTYQFWGIGWYKWTDILCLPFALFAIQMIVCNRRNTSASNKDCLHISDKPIVDSAEDLFGYDWMSQSLLDDLATVDVEKKSFSLGILGEWGQGKSSFVNLFKQHAQKQGAVVVEFYPRASKTIRSIQEDFFCALKTELRLYGGDVEEGIPYGDK